MLPLPEEPSSGGNRVELQLHVAVPEASEANPATVGLCLDEGPIQNFRLSRNDAILTVISANASKFRGVSVVEIRFDAERGREEGDEPRASLRTAHVNPDKLHHCLSAGREVVASPIPAAGRLKRYLHLMTADGDWATVLSDLTCGRQNNWPRETYTWDRRRAELLSFVLPDEAVVDGFRPAAQP